MKKLMTMLAAVGMAFGLFATDPDPVVDTVDFSDSQYEFTTDAQWTYNGAAISTAPADKVWVANNLLNLATGSDKVQRTFVAGSAVAVASNVYFDVNINFEDPFDEPPAVTDANAKIAAFVLDNSGIIEELGEAAKVAASTNLYVIAGYNNNGTWEKRAFMFATPADEGIASKTEKRLTIKAYGNVMDGAATRMGFRFFLNGGTGIKNALAVKYVFKVNEDGSIDFTDYIAAEDETADYLGTGVKESLKAAVRLRYTDQTLVLGLTEFAGALTGFDLAGKGELAKFELTTESPEFIGPDSKTMKIEANEGVDEITVQGASYDPVSGTIIYALGTASISVSATYKDGFTDIVKWTYQTVDVTPNTITDPVDIVPAENAILTIHAAKAAAFVDVNGKVTPYETFAEALEAVQVAGGTLKLAQNYTDETQAIQITSSEEVIIDLAGKTLTGNGGDLGSVFNTGNLTITNSVGEGHIAGTVSIVNAGTLKIAEGVMDGVVQTGFASDPDMPGMTTIIGGTFDGNVTVIAEDSSLETTGGNFDKDVFATEDDIPGVPKSGYEVVDNGDGYWLVQEISTYTVTIEPGEGTTLTVKNGDTPVETGSKVAKGTELTLAVEAMASFKDAKIYVDAAEYTDKTLTVNKDVKITSAATQKAVYTVTFTTNGCTTVAFDTKEVMEGEKLGAFNTPADIPGYTGAWDQPAPTTEDVINAAKTYNYTYTAIAVTGVTLDFNALTMNVNDVSNLVATIAPPEALVQTVEWEITVGNDVVEITPDGNSCSVKALKEGSATITATADGQTATCSVTVTAASPWPQPDPSKPDAEAVAEAMENAGFSPAAAAAIGTKAEYAQFTDYCDKQEITTSTEGAIKVNAVLTYALDAAACNEAITSEDITIETYDQAAGKLTVKIEGITAGANIKSEVLAKVLTAKGGAELKALSTDNVTVTGYAPAAGEIEVTVAPKVDGTPTAFFYQIELKQ